MQTTRQLLIDGDQVVFAIEFSGQAMSASPGKLPEPTQPFLGATVIRNGEEVWSGIIARRASALASIDEQFTDQDLERLYREARAVR